MYRLEAKGLNGAKHGKSDPRVVFHSAPHDLLAHQPLSERQTLALRGTVDPEWDQSTLPILRPALALGPKNWRHLAQCSLILQVYHHDAMWQDTPIGAATISLAPRKVTEGVGPPHPPAGPGFRPRGHSYEIEFKQPVILGNRTEGWISGVLEVDFSKSAPRKAASRRLRSSTTCCTLA